MVEVFPVRTPTVPPATHTNCYRIGGVVVDPASPWAEEQEGLAERLGARVDVIVVTHHHPDHVGGVEALRARTGAQVWAHRDARLPFAVDRLLDDDDVVDTGAGRLRCLHTPGHADGHLAFLVEDTGEVIAGDLVAGLGTIVIAEPEGHLATYVASLERVAALAGAVHPAHGPAVADGPSLLRQYVAHRHMRTEQLAEVLRAKGACDAETAAREVYAGVPGVDLRLAAAQLRTHATWLVEQGRARWADAGRIELKE